MRRCLLLLLLTIFVSFASAQHNQTEENRFAIKVQPFYGTYLDKGSHFDKFREMGPFAPSGVNLGWEFPSDQQRPWQQYLGNSTLGLGMSLIDFGNAKVGKSLSMYPYLLIPAVRNEHFGLSFKLAAGLGFVTEHWYTGNVDPDNYEYYGDDVNTIFGCYLNAYLSAGVNLNVPITRNVSFNGEFGYFHMSNGRTCMPNIGANILYGGVGVVTTFNPDVKKEAIQFPDLPYKWALNITGAAGGHRAWMYYPRYLISSFHAGAVYSANNWYGVGLGLDVFYNDAVDKNTGRALYCNGFLTFEDEVSGNKYEDVKCNTCPEDYKYSLADKVRAGISLNNEFRFGAVTAIVDWGVYFYNHARNHYNEWHEVNYEKGGTTEKRPLFYKAIDGAGGEEAFHYIRFGMKYRIWDNLYLQTTAKTHLHICEYVEFGVGYQIPFLKKNLRKDGSNIFHHKKGWWK